MYLFIIYFHLFCVVLLYYYQVSSVPFNSIQVTLFLPKGQFKVPEVAYNKHQSYVTT